MNKINYFRFSAYKAFWGVFNYPLYEKVCDAKIVEENEIKQPVKTPNLLVRTLNANSHGDNLQKVL